VQSTAMYTEAAAMPAGTASRSIKRAIPTGLSAGKRLAKIIVPAVCKPYNSAMKIAYASP
jgi:hypothetical protein